jgi:hypothetical protein
MMYAMIASPGGGAIHVNVTAVPIVVALKLIGAPAAAAVATDLLPMRTAE